MRVAIVGATGNVGSALVRALQGEERVTEIIGIARRPPGDDWPKVTWRRADIARDNLDAALWGADVIVSLAWVIQPSHDEPAMRAINVDGSRRVFEAAARAGARALVYASSVGAYSPGPRDRPVDESWPTGGIPTSFYSRHKAEVERILDRFERDHDDIRVVRMRPGLIFQRSAGAEIRRYFVGKLLPSALLRRERIPFVPRIEGLRLQAAHADDVADAYRRAILDEEARGAFNVAAEPVLDPDELARLLDARPIGVPARLLRTIIDLTWRARLQPTPPGWLDMGLQGPVMDTTRVREVLGWSELRSSGEALLDVLEGLGNGAGDETPALAPTGARRFSRTPSASRREG